MQTIRSKSWMTVVALAAALPFSLSMTALANEPVQKQQLPPGTKIEKNMKLEDEKVKAIQGSAKVVPTLPASEQPRALELGEEQFNWGVISDTQPVSHDVVFKNITQEEISLAVAASCGCTTTALEKTVYKPGESGKVTAKFDPKGRMGPQTKTLTFTVTNPQGKYTQQMVQLSAEVKARVWFDPPKMYLNEVDHSTGQTAQVNISGRKEGFQITKIESSNPSVTTKLGTPIIEEFGGDKVVKIPVDVVVGKGAQIGNMQAQLTITTNDDTIGTQTYFLGADVVGDIKSTPNTAIIRTNDPSTPFSTQLKLDSRSGSAFNVTSIDVDARKDMQAVADVTKGEGGNFYMVTLSGVTPAEGGVVQGFVVVSTDARGGETMKIPFTAVIRRPAQATLKQ